jgi:hypothetical protein
VTTLSSSPPEKYHAERTGYLDLERPQGDALVTFRRQATPGTTYVRCLLPARHLGGQSLPLETSDLQWDEVNDSFVLGRHQGDCAVWQFLGDDFRSRIAWGLQDQGVRTLMECDDNYLTPHPHLPGQAVAWHRTIKESKHGTGYSNEMHRLIVPTMDGVIVATEYLRDLYLEHHDHVYFCPNTVDPDDWVDLAEKDPNVLRIVYSGSLSHLRDAPQVTKALKWASRQKGVQVWLQGVRPPTWTFARHSPWSDFLHQYRHDLGMFDVGVAPLVPGRWANGKSDLKALEYTMAGVVPLLSRTEPYRPWFDKPEFMVDPNEVAWLDRVKWLLKNRDALPGMLETAREYVLAERTTQANVWRWMEAIKGA